MYLNLEVPNFTLIMYVGKYHYFYFVQDNQTVVQYNHGIAIERLRDPIPSEPDYTS